MLKYILKQCKIKDSRVYGRWFAYPLIEETVDIDSLAAHMAKHNTPYSAGAIKGILTDMVTCVKELLLEGKNVKVKDLAIFSIGIKNKAGGSQTEADFSTTKNIDGVKLRARATGTLTAANLNLDASLRKSSAAATSPSPATPGEDDTPSDDDSEGQTGGQTGGTGGESDGGMG